MFNFSGNNKSKIAITDKIWLAEENKWQACVQQVKNEKDTIICVWFDDSFQKIEAFFSGHGLPTDKIIPARELARNYIQNNALIFAEHYPLRSKEQEFYEKLGLTEVTVYSSLDEPLFTHFGGDKISNLRYVAHHPPDSWSVERRREYLDWTEQVIAGRMLSLCRMHCFCFLKNL